MPAVIHTVSRKGIFVQTASELNRDDVIGLVIEGDEVDGKREPLELYATIAWYGSKDIEDLTVPGAGCRLSRARQDDGWERWERKRPSVSALPQPRSGSMSMIHFCAKWHEHISLVHPHSDSQLPVYQTSMF